VGGRGRRFREVPRGLGGFRRPLHSRSAGLGPRPVRLRSRVAGPAERHAARGLHARPPRGRAPDLPRAGAAAQGSPPVRALPPKPTSRGSGCTASDSLMTLWQ
jgi:hypothetical protein